MGKRETGVDRSDSRPVAVAAAESWPSAPRRSACWKRPPPAETLKPFAGHTDLFIRPPYQFRTVDALLTNFHLPRTTLLVLVRTFGGDELIRRAYDEAIREQYRFYSYGDAMLIL